MKRLIFLLFVFSLSLSKAQTYTPMVQDSLVWYVNAGVYDAQFNQGWSTPYAYRTLGDTIVNSKVYYKFYVCDNSSYPNLYCNNFYSLMGFVREENKKVYLKLIDSNAHNSGSFVLIQPNNNPTDTVEKLIYDFNWSVNDTIIDTQSSDGQFTKTIAAIDSMAINSVYRDAYYIPEILCWNHEVVIEGIGSTLGPLELYKVCFESNACLSRFIDLKTGFEYVNPDTLCNIPLGLPGNIKPYQLIIYSSAGQININKANNMQILNYNLYNVTGSLIMSGTINENKAIQVIPGIYILQVFNSSGQNQNQKLVVY